MPLLAPSQSWPSTSLPCWRGTRQPSHACRRSSSPLWPAHCSDASSSSLWADTHPYHLCMLINDNGRRRDGKQATIFCFTRFFSEEGRDKDEKKLSATSRLRRFDMFLSCAILREFAWSSEDWDTASKHSTVAPQAWALRCCSSLWEAGGQIHV